MKKMEEDGFTALPTVPVVPTDGCHMTSSTDGWLLDDGRVTDDADGRVTDDQR